MRTLAIDPGLDHCGVAMFHHGELETAFLIQASSEVPANGGGGRTWRWTHMAESVRVRVGVYTRVVIEEQQIYQRGKGDNNDLIDLAGVVGALAYIFRQSIVLSYPPRVWKGSTPKDVMLKRIQSWLSPDELNQVIVSKSKKHQTDVFDAIGIGIHHLREKGFRP